MRMFTRLLDMDAVNDLAEFMGYDCGAHMADELGVLAQDFLGRWSEWRDETGADIAEEVLVERDEFNKPLRKFRRAELRTFTVINGRLTWEVIQGVMIGSNVAFVSEKDYVRLF